MWFSVLFSSSTSSSQPLVCEILFDWHFSALTLIQHIQQQQQQQQQLCKCCDHAACCSVHNNDVVIVILNDNDDNNEISESEQVSQQWQITSALLSVRVIVINLNS